MLISTTPIIFIKKFSIHSDYTSHLYYSEHESSQEKQLHFQDDKKF